MTQPDTAEEIESAPLELPSGRISVMRSGRGADLVFLHGAGGAGTWTEFHTRLSTRFTVTFPDHPGFGGSDELPDVEAMDDLVYHYLDVFDRLRLDNPVLVGTSFGGWIAAELAVHSPERFARLVLLAPVGLRIPGEPITDIFRLPLEERARLVYYDEAVAQSRLPAEPDIDFVVQRYRDDTALARFGWSPLLADPKLERRLPRISAATLVVAAGEDRLLPRAHCERYADAIPNARLSVIDQCGHSMLTERPDAAAAAVLDFLG